MRSRTLFASACLGMFLSTASRPAEPPTYGPELLALADKDDAQALAKLQQLAEGGHAQAQYDLGRHYLHTIRNDDDFPRVASWFQKASEQGVSKAQLDLGVTLNMPGKAWYDPVQALKWFNVGMALTLQEHPDGSLDHYAVFAAGNAFKLGQTLSKEQVREAESRSRAWLDGHGVSADQEHRNLGAFLRRYKAKHPDAN